MSERHMAGAESGSRGRWRRRAPAGVGVGRFAARGEPSVRARLVVLVLSVLAPTAAIAAAGAAYVWHAGRQATARDLDARVRALAADVAQELDISKAVLLTLAASPSLAAGDFEAFRRQCDRAPKPDGARVVLTDAAGQPAAGRSLTPVPAPPTRAAPGAVEPVFTTEQVQVSDLYAGATAREYLVAIAVPIERDGKKAYDLGMEFTSAAFVRTLERERLPRGWLATVMDGTGRILARNAGMDAFVGLRVAEETRAAIARGEGVFTATSQEGYSVLAANARVPGAGWSVFVAMRMDLIVADLLRSLATTAAASLAVLLLGLLFAASHARRIARPLHALVDAADALALGGHPPPTPPGVREASRIGGALARAAAALRTRAQELRDSEARFRHQAQHDDLTGLPNRVLFRDRLVQALEAGQGATAPALAVAVLDLDGFKEVNDTLGHPAGDALLVSVGQRLRAAADPGDTFARLGGDEFGLLLRLADAGGAEAAVERVLRLFDVPLTVDGREQHVTASAGVTLCPRDGTDPDQLLRQADLALYRAKEDGGTSCHFFAPELTARLRARHDAGRELRRALERGELVLRFQPQVDAVTRSVVAAEALVRWAHPERGLLAPSEFFGFAEAAGLMASIGDWVLREACTQAAAWSDAGVAVSVNIAPAQWRAGHDLVARVGQGLAETGLAPGRLKLEITEDALLEAEEARSLPALRHLRRSGVRVSLDDFGTGHSGLSRLRRLPIDEIKIDRSFVAGVGQDPGDEAIARTVVALARALGHQVVAEGVETEMQLAFLRRIGCEVAQGFLFGRPLDSAAIAALLAR